MNLEFEIIFQVLDDLFRAILPAEPWNTLYKSTKPGHSVRCCKHSAQEAWAGSEFQVCSDYLASPRLALATVMRPCLREPKMK